MACGNFNCHENSLTSLEGAPQEVGGDFYCYHNPTSVSELKKTIDRTYLNKIRESVLETVLGEG